MKTDYSGALTALEDMRNDARIGKHSHFEAAHRKQKYHVRIGIPLVFLNLVVGTLLISVFQVPLNAQWFLILAGTVLTFSAACLGALQTFFGFEGASNGHRRIGNRYLEVARECFFLSQKLKDDQISIDEIWIRIENLRSTYEQINRDSEFLSTSDQDYQKALPRTLQTRREDSVANDVDPPDRQTTLGLIGRERPR